jgi:bifunctional DNase/RNase
VPVRMELTRVVDCDLNDQHWIHLTEVGGPRTFTIVIGQIEAQVINRRLLEEPPFRPLTHQLLKNIIETLGGQIEDIIITELREHTYFAVVRIRVADQLHAIDCRPSDGIALAVHHSPILPIYIEENVLKSLTGI